MEICWLLGVWWEESRGELEGGLPVVLLGNNDDGNTSPWRQLFQDHLEAHFQGFEHHMFCISG